MQEVVVLLRLSKLTRLDLLQRLLDPSFRLTCDQSCVSAIIYSHAEGVLQLDHFLSRLHKRVDRIKFVLSSLFKSFHFTLVSTSNG